MNMKRSQSLARKATALLSAIAASSLLGLPALAGGKNDAGNMPTAQSPATQSQTTDSSQMQCVPNAQSSLPSTTATPDAAAPSASQTPNQADPRAGLSQPDQMTQRTETQSASDMRMVAPNMNVSNDRSQSASYGDVLAQGGVTTGGFASQKLAMSRNSNANRDMSDRYNSNQASMSTDRSSMTGNASATMSADSMMSQPSNSSSRSMTGTTIAQCPPGMTPGASQSEMRQSPAQMTP